jgi:tRNA nucleotidyltransferase/poly(A) polymerase
VYANPLTGDIIDPEEGLADIRSRIIRTVGDATESFTQDPLRMVRALRFHTQYECTLAPETESALTQCLPLLQNISATKIENEIAKIKNVAQQKFVHNNIKNS